MGSVNFVFWKSEVVERDPWKKTVAVDDGVSVMIFIS